MLKYRLIILFTFFCILAPAQTPVGNWTDHLSYSTIQNIAIGGNEVYASTGSSVMIYNKTYNELSKLSRVQGLSEAGISYIAFSSENNSLIISYTSTNIDIVKDNTVHNIPDIKRKYIPGKKEIYRIWTKGKYAYVATTFGIVLIDLLKFEISDTWKPGTGPTAEVYDLTINNNKIYAATSSGVFSADLDNPGLSYYSNWTQIKTLPGYSSPYNLITASGNNIYVNKSAGGASGDSVFVIGTGTSLFSFQSGIYNRSFDSYTGGFTITSQNLIRIFSETGTLTRSINSTTAGTSDISQAVNDGSDIWIADLSKGLIRGDNSGTFSRLELPGPYTNNVLYISVSAQKAFISGGGVDNAWNNQGKPFQVFINENNVWRSEIDYSIKDAMRVLPDPDNNNHYFVSSWGGGLLEYSDNVRIHKYDDSNSPLKTIIPGAPYSRVCGLAMDKSHNVWMTQTQVQGSIKVLKPDGTWITNPLTIDAPTIGDIIITRTGLKIVILPRGFGIFVFDDNSTPENFNDDRSKTMLIKDNDGNVISTVYSIAEDLDGSIWVGTDQGPAIYYNPEKLFDQDPKAYRVIVPRNDGTGLGDPLLKSEIITSIAVDGANRKWLGTFSSGAYLLSSDGTKKIANFTEENSPVYSNTIASIAIDGKSGEVWFGTAKGLISYRGEATSGGDEFKNVYAFPNPVRPEFSGNITITGLMSNTDVKITDVSGNLVYETISDGGQASWNLKTYNGSRVSTGVYVVFCASPDGSKSFVTKILVVK